MRKHVLLFIILLISLTKSFSETHVTGNISSNTTWTKANSLYILDGTVGVPAAYTLTIEPGVTVQRAADYQILINGAASFKRSAADRITFSSGAALTTFSTFFIEFQKSNLDNSSLRFISFHANSGNANNLRIGNESEFSQTSPQNSGSLLISRSNLSNGVNDQLGGTESWYASAVLTKILPSPPAITYSNSNLTHYLGQAITPLSPANSGGAIPSNYINNVTTIAGNGTLALTNGTGTATSFYYPAGLTTDVSGNIYVADANNAAIRKITPSGVVSTFAKELPLNYPTGVTADAAGNLYVADQHLNAILKITAAGVITTFAGTAPGDLDGTGTNARLYAPSAIVTDATGNLFITDEGNHRIKKITPAGVVTTIAGSGTSAFVNGTGVSAGFKSPHGITVDQAGNLYVTDLSDFRIRKITPAGVVTTFAGSGAAGTADGAGITASFAAPTNITIDGSGNLYVTDLKLIRKITPDGVVSTIAGNASSGSADGVGVAASFNTPWGVTVDADGNLIIADGFSKIRKLALTGYGISPLLPNGLSFSTTGAISGTPTALSPQTAYKITGANSSGVSTATINIAVQLVPAPNISYSGPNIYTVNTSITALSATSSGGAVPAGLYAQTTTVAGGVVPGSSNGTASFASFNNPQGLATDASGNIYVADALNNKIRKITPAGVVTTFTGTGVAGSLNGTLSTATFNTPGGIAFDNVGNMFVADGNSHKIRKITPDGTVSTLAGDINGGYADGQGTAAKFTFPWSIVTDAAGNIYVTDTYNNAIRKVTSAGVVTTFAGNATAHGAANGTGAVATFNIPIGLAIDAGGNLFVADQSNYLIRKITPAGVVTTFSGSGQSGTADGTSVAASFTSPTAITIDATGNLYVTDKNLIRMITAQGVVTTLAGNSTAASADGIGASAGFNNPFGLVTTPSGNLFIAEGGTKPAIRKLALTGYSISPTLPPGLTLDGMGTITGTPKIISPAASYTIIAANTGGVGTAKVSIATTVSLPAVPNISYKTPQNYGIGTAITPLLPVNSGGDVAPGYYGQVTTIAGTGAQSAMDGTGTAASFNFPAGLATDAAGNIFVADAVNGKIRKVTPAGVVTTFAGGGGNTYVNAKGTSAGFSYPTGVTFDGAGNLYVADQNNQVIRKITSDGTVSTFAGTGYEGTTNGAGTVATFTYPTAVVADAFGNLFVTEELSSIVRKITPAGVVSTFAGNGVKALVNGTGTNSSFFKPQGIAVDLSSNLYVADFGNYCIRKITPAGVVTTFAGSGTKGTADGIGTAASFSGPQNVTVDIAGNVYVTDQGSNLIRKITPSGIVTTIAGNSSQKGALDGIGSAATFNYPWGITIDALGNLIVADKVSNKIRKVTLSGYAINTALPDGLSLNINGAISGTPTKTIAAKDYTITAYNVSGTSNATLNIATKTVPVIKATPPSAPTYGDADITLVATSTNTVTPITYSSSNPKAITIVNGKLHIAGSGISVIKLSQIANDSFLNADTTLTVTVKKAQLTVTANNLSRRVGQPNPAFVFTYKGFVNNEDTTVLLINPVVSTRASVSSPVGVYDLIPSGANANNYDFTYINGTITVTPPVTNLKISGTSVTCKGSKNGSITIEPATVLNYTAVITATNYTKTHHFSSKIAIDTLSPNTYHVCVSTDNIPGVQQCSDIVITEPKDLAVYATVNKTINTVSLNLTGGQNYTVKLNGTEYQTSSNSITLPLNRGSNKLSVTTDKLCQGTIEQIIDLSGITAPYPNPFQDVLYVNLGEGISKVATISIFNVTSGAQVLSQKFTNQSGVVRLDVSGLQSGVYTVNLLLDAKLSTFKIIKL